MDKLFEDIIKNRKSLNSFVDNIFVGGCKLQNKSEEGFAVLFGMGNMLHIMTTDYLNEEDVEKEKDLKKMITKFAQNVLEETGQDTIQILLANIYGQGKTVTVKVPKDLNDMFEDIKKDIPDEVKKSIDNIINFLDEKNKKR